MFAISRRPNRQKASQMTSQSPSGTLPGTLQEAEIDPLFAPRAFQGRQDDFVGTPRAVPEALRDASGERLAAGSGPRAAQRPPGSHFGAVWDPFGSDLGTILERFWSQVRNTFSNPLPRHSCYNCVPDAQGRRVPALALTISRSVIV